MWPNTNSNVPPQSGDGLEDRLRGMILNNSGTPASVSDAIPRDQSRQNDGSPRGGRFRSRRQRYAGSKSNRGPDFDQNIQSDASKATSVPTQHQQRPSYTDRLSQSSPQFQGRRHVPTNSGLESKRFAPKQHHSRDESYTNQGRNSLVNGRPAGFTNHSSRPSQHLAVIDAAEADFQASLLETIAAHEIPGAQMGMAGLNERLALGNRLENIARHAILEFESQKPGSQISLEDISLQQFGSVRSGFATKNSDMDLALVSLKSQPPPSSKDSPIPRLLEKVLLDHGYGARLLTRTRVPIIRFCELPTTDLLEKLREARQQWEAGINQEAEAEPPKSAWKASPTPAAEDSSPNFPPKMSQKASESLVAYHRRAKRIIEAIGIQDYHVSKSEKLSPKERMELLDIVESFLEGLRDNDLKSRLLSYPSLDLEAARSSDRIISLYEASVHAEGEMLAMCFESRKIMEINNEDEAFARSAVDEWFALQNSTKMYLRPYLRGLRLAVDKLKSFKSIQLADLHQLWESTEQYSDRARQLLVHFGGPEHDQPFLPTQLHIFTEVASKFVEGISKNPVRSRVRVFLETHNPRTMEDLIRQLHEESRLEQYLGASFQRSCTDEEKALIKSYATATQTYGATSKEPELLRLKDEVDLLSSSKDTEKDLGDKFSSPLEFPKFGVGIQCDINFSNYVALHNTQMLRCYNLCDIRVHPMVIFVKLWAKRRAINSPYRATLSSYGYVLMVLHFLINVTQPPILPNLQGIAFENNQRPLDVDGFTVNFFGDEDSIRARAASRTLLPQHNHQPLGRLLRDFFAYYSRQNSSVIGGGFDWMHDVISIRTPGGILTKSFKGWTGAKTTLKDSGNDGTREIRHRYLMAIEDPFEVEHNIARTVAHDGICKIRDEFRRAWELITRSSNADQIASLLEEVQQNA